VVFGHDYFADHAQSVGTATPKLLSYEGVWGAGEEYAYEALNFADEKHDVQQICDELSAEYGPVPRQLVAE
jgi:aminopeptidase YwaD